jgi:hypothetical protein
MFSKRSDGESVAPSGSANKFLLVLALTARMLPSRNGFIRQNTEYLGYSGIFLIVSNSFAP